MGWCHSARDVVDRDNYDPLQMFTSIEMKRKLIMEI
jgi:hypothetical protein